MQLPTPTDLPITTQPSEKGPCPSRHGGGGWSPPPRRELERRWGDGEGQGAPGRGCDGAIVRVPVCVAHTPSCLCAGQVCVCPPRVPTRRVHVSVGRAPCARPAAQPAAHSWARGAMRSARCEVAGV